ncbi:patatin family protein [Cytobacillus sp. FSL W7-1323]|uniref:patatin-like phospholipase family protein n=1 Tax=Cytobacillus TaxID=2675230 RepID=UPI001CD77153|nr:MULTISPECIES: patatin family protein [Cytobacillus]MCA1027297.1 patatin family protein [Cytobacillus kochii]MCM3320961.1 patatin family protein [Cytobacillus kochii]MCM3344206.1 patatin family protein [Cytobacillus kochii]MDM5208049.1 patatin family protein [Cytobacillus kochii]MDQ0184111.1 putative patatin/cPLA2 family phospholipase [Cytobacillus kochii]
MNVHQTALVLEGGGMRAAYSAGVMELFLDKGITFPYVIGVSAGAANAASYLSKQKGRNKKVSVEYVSDPRYFSLRNYRKSKQLFGMDFIFDEIPNKLVPYDYEAFSHGKSEFIIGTTDCLSGEAVYYGKKDYGENLLLLLKASSSLPFIAPEISFNNRMLLDGGIADSIPIRKAQADGYDKAVVVLTRPKGYRKKPSRMSFLLRRKYPQYPGLQRAMMNRYKMYNETVEYLEEQEKKGQVMIIRPEKVDVGRMERDLKKLSAFYEQGYKDAEDSLTRFIF